MDDVLVACDEMCWKRDIRRKRYMVVKSEGCNVKKEAHSGFAGMKTVTPMF